MKKFVNNPTEVVADALNGFQIAHHGQVVVNRNPDYVSRIASTKKVAIVSGGGSGHEPLHIGFVGYGMLDAAVPGAVFASPSATQIYAAAKSIGCTEGVLFIVKNYTGDRLNFQMAADLLSSDGIDTELVLVNDDVAVEDSTHTAGRRGTGATIFVEKIAGAAAEEGRSLQEVAAIARTVNERTRSMGLAFSSSIVPHLGSPNFQLNDDEVELGVGIHGEPGRRRISASTAKELLGELTGPIFDDLHLDAGERVLALVNGLGGTPLIELYVMAGELNAYCDAHQITIDRSLVGSFVTSLEMQGCTITLMRSDDELLRLWDAPVSTPSLRW
jgi:phosphoenolpyruvate---glycerone phosphotransferase subunit DhaK